MVEDGTVGDRTAGAVCAIAYECRKEHDVDIFKHQHCIVVGIGIYTCVHRSERDSLQSCIGIEIKI